MGTFSIIETSVQVPGNYPDIKNSEFFVHEYFLTIDENIEEITPIATPLSAQETGTGEVLGENNYNEVADYTYNLPIDPDITDENEEAENGFEPVSTEQSEDESIFDQSENSQPDGSITNSGAVL